MKPLAYRPEADRELDDSIGYYDNRQAELGKIQRNPSTGFSSEEGTRTLRITDFPFGIVFLELDNCVQIIAVSHFSRRPGYWISRLEDES